jgi:hypothetical protein
VGPTILEMLGVAVPPELQGKPIPGFR